MAISFDLIPSKIYRPDSYVEFDNSRAIAGPVGEPSRILVIGQQLAGGSATPLTLTQILSGAQAYGLYGANSMLAAMIAALKAANQTTECWAIGLSDAEGATAATGSILLAGPATDDGSIALYLGGTLVTCAVSAGDTADVMATNLVAAINATPYVCVTAAVDADVAAKVDLTMAWAGVTGNSFDVRFNYNVGDVFPAGVTATVTAMSGGATDPDLADMIAVLGDNQYTTLICPYTSAEDLTELETELERRWGPMVAQEGLAFGGAAGSFTTLTTLGATRNSKQDSIMGSGLSPTPPWVWAAVYGAVDAAEPDPARPRTTLPLPGLLAPAPTDRFTADERELLLEGGISTYTVGQDGTIAIERGITTYQTDTLGIVDTSYLDVTTMRTLASLRYTLRAMVALNFPRMKLADDGSVFGPGQAIVTPSSIKAAIIGLFMQWQINGLVENVAQFTAQMIVERNASDPNRVDVQLPPELVGQLLVFAGQIQFLL